MSLEKILVHLSTNEMNIYSLKNGTLSFLKADNLLSKSPRKRNPFIFSHKRAFLRLYASER